MDGLTCAVADGATISYDSASWAKLLTQKAVEDPRISSDWLNATIALHGNGIRRDALPWMKQAAFDRGSFSTLSIVRVDRRLGALILFAIGDTNVFVVDRRRISLAFPLTNADQFTNAPLLISSQPAENKDAEAIISAASHNPIDLRTFRDPLVICIATDALACWALKQEDPASALAVVASMNGSDFLKFVVDERHAGRMRTDDTTLLVMRRG